MKKLCIILILIMTICFVLSGVLFVLDANNIIRNGGTVVKSEIIEKKLGEWTDLVEKFEHKIDINWDYKHSYN